MSNIIMCDPKGGDPYDLARKLSNDTITEYIDDEITYLRGRAFSNNTSLLTVQTHNVTAIGGGFIDGSGIKTLALPKLNKAGNTANAISAYSFTSVKLETLDLGNQITSLLANAMNGASKLSTIVFRSTSVLSLSAVNAFGGTPFKSGGAGGTIYIPKSLYDHLGDGSANDYKAATNWSTVDGYGTITWAKIEGSIYETKYADGTTIPT